AKAAGAPIIPGSDGPVTSPEEAKKIDRQIGYPVIVKASAGGGGRGMRIAHTEMSLGNALLAAQAEAEKAFGNGAVYLEKYLENPRHVEIQILADNFGNVAHLGERDCSIQRRHQKLIEESPSPVMTPELREQMGAAAAACARQCEYSGAGTVEFLVDQEGRNFFFMEMNTRVQVEHPVSEAVTGVDIIAEQISIASGHPLSVTQDQIKFCGHAIECRINAEDPDRDFMPCPGKIKTFHLPGGLGVRVDSHAYQDYVIPPYYDSMIAKLIVHAPSRMQAIKRMERALDEFIVEGVKTTIPFHQRVLTNAHFIEGRFGTNFIDTYF
ncbi:MAG: ATP-grasp domain-containing protein, partial [Candidatus Sumerlaeota bacterium]|nr:ATP-grasp domain-containing protein [Candidatus Sumerlaeota bacterium]